MTKLSLLLTALLTVILVIITELRLLGDYSPTGLIEVAAVISTGLCVWLAVKNSVWTWTIGLIGSGLYLYLFYQWGLYADAGLQIVYLIMGVVGLTAWLIREKKVEKEEAFEAETSSWVHLGLVLLFIGLGTFIVRDYLIEINGAAPFWDALLTSGSLGANYLLIRKRIETWTFWAILDVIYVALFINRGYYLTAMIYFVLLLFVIRAAIEWRGLLKVNHKPGNNSTETVLQESSSAVNTNKEPEYV
jgi:nicotinamide mononucleotide transporter